VQVSADKSVVFLPLLAVLPGVGSFGRTNTRGSLLVSSISTMSQPFRSGRAWTRGPSARARHAEDHVSN